MHVFGKLMNISTVKESKYMCDVNQFKRIMQHLMFYLFIIDFFSIEERWSCKWAPYQSKEADTPATS